jgi:hypothetical protein
MPCLNEAKTVGICVKKALQFLKREGIAGEVVIGDNGSTDGSREIAKKAGARVIAVPQKGYGAALMGAIDEAQGTYVIMGDSDDSYDFTNLMPFVHKLRAGYDIVVGNRFKGGIKKGAMPFLHRYLGNPVLSSIGRLFFSLPITDFHCGLRGFSKMAYERLQLQTPGMEFASEMIVKAGLLKLKMCQVPTTLSPDGRGRPPHLRTWRDGWRHLRFLLLYSPKWLFLIPGVLITIFCTIMTIVLALTPITIQDVTFDVHTLLFSALGILLGIQCISFYVLSKQYASTIGLLPKTKEFTKTTNHWTLEAGLISGGALCLLGIALSALALLSWINVSFGELDVHQTLRFAILGSVCFILGVQIGLNSFLLSILRLQVRP